MNRRHLIRPMIILKIQGATTWVFGQVAISASAATRALTIQSSHNLIIITLQIFVQIIYHARIFFWRDLLIIKWEGFGVEGASITLLMVMMVMLLSIVNVLLLLFRTTPRLLVSLRFGRHNAIVEGIYFGFVMRASCGIGQFLPLLDILKHQIGEHYRMGRLQLHLTHWGPLKLLDGYLGRFDRI